MKVQILLVALLSSLTACGQTQDPTYSKTGNIKIENKLDLSKITNGTVRKAIEALQQNDKKTWYSYFTENTVFTDDGRTLDFKTFFDNAFGKKEKFLSIDKIENEGKDIYGNFYAGQWGTFRVYFRFQLNADGEFTRLDIGQAPE